MVEGAHRRTSRNDIAKHCIHVFEHIASGNAQNAKAFTSKHRITCRIPTRPVTEIVSFSIDFNDQATLQAGEIDGHFADWELLPELESLWPFPQYLPKQHLGEAHLAPQLAGALDLLDGSSKDLGIDPAWAPSTALRAVPLPVPGRIIEPGAPHL